MKPQIILGIESSCDDTAAAVLRNGALLSSVSSTDMTEHERYGGIVPEIASRRHERVMMAVIEEALVRADTTYADVSAIAVTYGPGLVGSLLVGVATARSLGLVIGCPVYGVNHLEGHLLSSFLEHQELSAPTLCLLVSGGHTMLVHIRAVGDYEILGETRDDAVGEAYDKVARYLGLGYPGGPEVDRMSKLGDPSHVALPRPMLHDGYEMSFSGLKSATVRAADANPGLAVQDLCASFVEATNEVLTTKIQRAITEHGLDSVCIGGGVAASQPLRDAVMGLMDTNAGLRCYVPPRSMCTDNAAMIGFACHLQLAAGTALDTFEVAPNLPMVGTRA